MLKHICAFALNLTLFTACSTDTRTDRNQTDSKGAESGKIGVDQVPAGTASPALAALQESRLKLQLKDLCRRAPATQKFSLTTRDGQREYIVYAPKRGCAKPASAILVFHGGFGTADTAENVSPFQAQADTSGSWVVYPEGLGRTWNDGRTDSSGAPLSQTDDLGFVRAILDQLAETTLVDMKRVYATGHSNGATMSLHLACTMADRFAAIAINAGTLPVGLKDKCRLKAPIPILMANGTDDELMQYEGGEGKHLEGERLSAEETAHLFVKMNGCVTPEKATRIVNLDPYDGARSTQFIHAACKGNSEVQHIKIEGGGHTWPGSEGSNFPVLGTGAPTYDFEMSAEAMNFFRRFSR